MKTIFKGTPFSVVWNIIDRTTNQPFDFTGMNVEVGLYSDSCKKVIDLYTIANGTITATIEANTLQSGVYGLMCRYSNGTEQAYCTYRNAFQITVHPCICNSTETIVLTSTASHIDSANEEELDDEEKLFAEELFKTDFRLPEFTAERALMDEHGNRIPDTYVTRKAVANHIKQIYNQQFLENPPLITEGYITPGMLSEETKQMLEATGQSITNLPDGEDLKTEHGVLKLADKQYNPVAYSGLGRRILRKNIVAGVNLLTQAMVSKPNTIYVIQYDYDLQGETITIPEGCVLKFEGGSFSNGTIVGDNTEIKAGKYECIKVKLEGKFITTLYYAEWFGIFPGVKGVNNKINKAILSISDIGGGVLKLNKGNYYLDGTIMLHSHVSLVGFDGAESVYTKNTILNYEPNNTSCYWAIDTYAPLSTTNEQPVYNYFHSSLSGETNVPEFNMTIKNLSIVGDNTIYGGVRLIKIKHAIIDNLDISGVKVGMYVTSCWSSYFGKIDINPRWIGLVCAVECTHIHFNTLQVSLRPKTEQMPATDNDLFLGNINYTYNSSVTDDKYNTKAIICYSTNIRIDSLACEFAHVGISSYNSNISVGSMWIENFTKYIGNFRGGYINIDNLYGAQWQFEIDLYHWYIDERNTTILRICGDNQGRVKPLSEGSKCRYIFLQKEYNPVGKYVDQKNYSESVEYDHHYTKVYVSNEGANTNFGFSQNYPISLKEAVKRIKSDHNYRNIKTIVIVKDIIASEETIDMDITIQGLNKEITCDITILVKDANVTLKNLKIINPTKTITLYKGGNITFDTCSLEGSFIRISGINTNVVFNSCILTGNPYSILLAGIRNDGNKQTVHIYQDGILLNPDVVSDILNVESFGNYYHGQVVLDLATKSYFSILAGKLKPIEITSSSERPIYPNNSIFYGKQFFDTTLNKPIWWTGTNWVDANGVEV